MHRHRRTDGGAGERRRNAALSGPGRKANSILLRRRREADKAALKRNVARRVATIACRAGHSMSIGKYRRKNRERSYVIVQAYEICILIVVTASYAAVERALAIRPGTRGGVRKAPAEAVTDLRLSHDVKAAAAVLRPAASRKSANGGESS